MLLTKDIQKWQYFETYWWKRKKNQEKTFITLLTKQPHLRLGKNCKHEILQTNLFVSSLFEFRDIRNFVNDWNERTAFFGERNRNRNRPIVPEQSRPNENAVVTENRIPVNGTINSICFRFKVADRPVKYFFFWPFSLNKYFYFVAFFVLNGFIFTTRVFPYGLMLFLVWKVKRFLKMQQNKN